MNSSTNSCTRMQSMICMTVFLTALCCVAIVPNAQARSLPRRRLPFLSNDLKSILSRCRGGSVIVESANSETSNSNSTVEALDTSSTCLNETTAFEYHSPDVNNLDIININEASTSGERKLKVLFLSADTGGGHRASAESLANQFLKYHPGTEYDLVDVWTPTEVYPYKTLVAAYKHLSAHPRKWKALYYISNTRLYEKITMVHSYAACYKIIKKQLEAYDPDVVISVHPTMCYLPGMVVRAIAQDRNKYIPFFTVVTDFGSGHCTWFQGMADKMYVASERIKKLAKGKVKDENLLMTGLPIRNDFADHAEKMGDRTSEEGKLYRKNMKLVLGLDPEKKVILLMGGGEGVGSLGKIAEKIYLKLRKTGVDASICVVCGRNEKLKNEFETKDWDAFHADSMMKGNAPSKRSKMAKFIRARGRKFSDVDTIDSSSREGNVKVVGLGFVSNMADYMVASTILVSKAGPGTIAEAASIGLPVLITSFLPGQEAGNVDIVLDGGFGAYEENPKEIAEQLSAWLKDDALVDEMSKRSAAAGNPHAASNIVKDIGEITLGVMEMNKKR